MSNHQKRLSVPKSWPVERKTATFTAKAGAGPHGEAGVPLVVVLRDVLGYVDTTKEAKYAAHHDGVLVNGDTVGDVTQPVGMFDILGFPERDEYYRVFPDEGGRLSLTEIPAADADGKLAKVTNKTLVPGGDVQLNLHNGHNLVVEEDEYSGNDSIVVDLDNDDVLAHFPYEEGALVTAVSGQHAGEVGEITEITVSPGSSSNTVEVETDAGSFETVEEYVFVIDEQFVDDEAAAEAEPEGDDE